MPVPLMLVLAGGIAIQVGQNSPTRPDWRADWAVEEGFTLDMHAEGFQLPTAIAVVPRPGRDAGAPLYFVTELGGTIKVVTRDGRVHVFADNIYQRVVREELPSEQGESGLAGICLAPAQGFVFATFTSRDSTGTLRNRIVRFDTDPERFGIQPRARRDIAPMLARFRSAPSHQIGPCQVDGELLYASVGDGSQTSESRNPEAPLGKVLRMTLDGRPAPGNPFATASAPESPQNFTWALGLRNPFSLNVVRGRVFVADNGPSVDRFLEAEAGGDYLWDGTDWSMGTNAVAVLTPSPSPVQMVYVESSNSAFPEEHRDRFYVAMAGLGLTVGPGNRRGAKGIVTFRYDFAKRRLTEVPRTVLRYRGAGRQYVVGLGVSEEGLYIAAMMPGSTGSSAILHLRYAPERAHPHLVVEMRTGIDLMLERGCLGCHAFGDRRTGNVGPPLDRDSLLERLALRTGDATYERSLGALDQRADEPAAHRAARAAVLAASGEDRVRLWVRYKIQQPRFENADAAMPDLRLTAGEAASIADFLVDGPVIVERSVFDRVREEITLRRLVLATLIFGAGALTGSGLALIATRRRRR